MRASPSAPMRRPSFAVSWPPWSISAARRGECLRRLPRDWAWERFAAEERRVSWDGYISYDGVLYGLPAALPGQEPRVGATVQVRERAGQLAIWSGGERILVVAKHTQSRAVVPHPEQFRGVAPAAAASRATIPLGHRIPAPVVALRDLGEYDRLFGAARMEGRQ